MNENNYESSERKVINLSIDDVLPNRFQPRLKFEDNAIFELSESIKAHGVFQPIIVRPIGDKYEIIAGERRYKASVLANKKTIPAIIMNLNDKDTIEIALIENVQRANLTPIEEAISYKKILDMGYMNQEKLAEKLGKTQSTIANKLRLLNLDEDVQEALLENKISERHARSLLKIKDFEQQKVMLKRIINERLTVRKTDEEIDKMFNENKPINNDPININSNPSVVSEVVENTIPENSIFGNTQQFINNEISQSENITPFSNVPSQQPTSISSDSLLKPTPAPQEPASKPVNEVIRTGKFFDFVPEDTGDDSNGEMKSIEAEKNFNFDSLYSNVINKNDNKSNVDAPTPTSSPVENVKPVEEPAPAATPFGFGNPVEEPAPAATPFGFGNPVEEPAPAATPFGFGNPVEEPAPAATPFGFGNPVEEPAPAATPFGFGNPVEEPAPAAAPFGFGNPVEEPTPAATPFGFGNPVEEPAPAATPFGFGNSVEEPAPISSDSSTIPENRENDVISNVSVPNNIQNVMKAVEIIREAKDKIEKMGFVVNMDEFDLENMYQLIIKIDKE